jgi:hypothetical protein
MSQEVGTRPEPSAHSPEPTTLNPQPRTHNPPSHEVFGQLRLAQDRRLEPWSIQFETREGGFGGFAVHLEDVPLEFLFPTEDQANEWATKSLGLDADRRSR